jgi:hypothetical protein
MHAQWGSDENLAGRRITCMSASMIFWLLVIGCVAPLVLIFAGEAIEYRKSSRAKKGK